MFEPGSAAARSTTRPGGTSSGSAIAKKALSRPLLTTSPCIDAMWSTELSSTLFICATGMFGEIERISAQAPETCGVAIEVPESEP